MFPIRNDNGDVIAFSGRLLEKKENTGKYVNSPETPVFSKSRVLFGFDKSKRFIAKADQAIICEGQIDMIMVFEAGLQNVVAGQGTAFTEHHAKMLKRVCNEVILCYDSDNAGREATEKAFRILSPQGISVRVAALPQGEDPDSLIRKEGAGCAANHHHGRAGVFGASNPPSAGQREIREHRRARAHGRAGGLRHQCLLWRGPAHHRREQGGQAARNLRGAAQ
jgi:DNA primase catalytic core